MSTHKTINTGSGLFFFRARGLCSAWTSDECFSECDLPEAPLDDACFDPDGVFDPAAAFCRRAVSSSLRLIVIVESESDRACARLTLCDPETGGGAAGGVAAGADAASLLFNSASYSFFFLA